VQKESNNNSRTSKKYTCPYCNGGLVESLTPEHKHYSRLDCIPCGKFVKWGKSPQVFERIGEQLSQVKRLLRMGGLSTWQRKFLASLGQWLEAGKQLSPKQSACLEKICGEVCDEN
jgi:hypothetical protein